MDFSHWDLRDSFSIKQAAALYFEVDPTEVNYCHDEVIGKINVVCNTLKKLIEGLCLPFEDEPEGVFIARQDDGKINFGATLISRETLKAFFKSKNQQPKFLFHTEHSGENFLNKNIEDQVKSCDLESELENKLLNRKERETMVKIIHALAKNGYRYPDRGALADILKDFDLNKNGVSENTLSKYLKEFDTL